MLHVSQVLVFVQDIKYAYQELKDLVCSLASPSSEDHGHRRAFCDSTLVVLGVVLVNELIVAQLLPAGRDRSLVKIAFWQEFTVPCYSTNRACHHDLNCFGALLRADQLFALGHRFGSHDRPARHCLGLANCKKDTFRNKPRLKRRNEWNSRGNEQKIREDQLVGN